MASGFARDILDNSDNLNHPPDAGYGNYAALTDVRLSSSDTGLTSPDLDAILATYRDDSATPRASTTVSQSQPGRCASSSATQRAAATADLSTVKFLHEFGTTVQEKAHAFGLTEENFQCLTDDDIAGLHATLAVQFKLRALRDKKKECDNNDMPVGMSNSTSGADTESALLATIRQKMTSLPCAADILAFCSSLNMLPMERLHGTFLKARILEMTEDGDERMDRKPRVRITRIYVRYVLVEYIKKFESPHPVADVISFVASKLLHHFPTMRDIETTKESPSYDELFVRYPIGGSVYDCFKNSNRGLPEEFKRRKRKTTAPAEAIVVDRPAPPPMPASYESKVQELQTASPARRDELMMETFEERRVWATQSREFGPTIETIMTTYPVFHSDVDQVLKECGRIAGEGYPQKGLKIIQAMIKEQEFLDPSDIIRSALRKMRVNNVDGALKQIMILKDPTTAANSTGGVISAHHDDKLFICVHGGFSLEVCNLCEMLSIFPLMHYILHIEMPTSTFVKFLAHVMGVKGEDGKAYKLSKTQHELISKYKR